MGKWVRLLLWDSCYENTCFYTSWSEDLLARPWSKIIPVFLASYWMISKAWICQCSLITVVVVGISVFMKLYFSPFSYVEKMEGKLGHAFSSLISKFKSHLLWSEIWWDLEDIPNPSFIFLSLFNCTLEKYISKKLSSFRFSGGELALS